MYLSIESALNPHNVSSQMDDQYCCPCLAQYCHVAPGGAGTALPIGIHGPPRKASSLVSRPVVASSGLPPPPPHSSAPSGSGVGALGVTPPPSSGSVQGKGKGINILGGPPLAPTGRPPLAPMNVANGRTVMLKDAPTSQGGGKPVKSARPPVPKSVKNGKRK
jgi:hypothetical protein